MKQVKWKRVLCAALSGCMALSLLAGCGNGKEAGKSGSGDYLNTASELPIATEPIDMSFVVQTSGTKPEEMWFWKWLKEKANINAEVKAIEASAWSEKFTLMMASGDYGDVFIGTAMYPADVANYGQNEPIFIPLNDLIDQYAPNVVKQFERNPGIKADAMANDGNIYSLPSVMDNVDDALAGQRGWIHTQWLKNLNLKEPETLDELYNVLVAFRDGDPNGNGIKDEIPFSGTWKDINIERIMIMTALGFPSIESCSLVVQDNKIVMPELDPRFKEYLTYMNKLYTEKLLDNDLFIQTDVQVNAKIAQNVVGMHMGAPVQDKDHYLEYESFKPLTSQVNSERMWPGLETSLPGKFMITDKCKYPEAAMRLADLFFTEKGTVLFWKGPQDGSDDALGFEGWKVENGKYTPASPVGVKSEWEYQTEYLNPLSGQKLGLMFDNKMIEDVYGLKIDSIDPVEKWWTDSVKERTMPYYKSQMPAIYFSKEDMDRITSLKMLLIDYSDKMEAKFITGDTPISEYDNYVQEMKKLGADEYVSLYQKGYDEYLSKLNK